MFSRITKREYHIKINVILSFCIPIIFNYIIVVNFFILSKVNFSVLENTISACFRISLFPIPIDISFAALMASAPAFASSIPAHCSGFTQDILRSQNSIDGFYPSIPNIIDSKKREDPGIFPILNSAT